MAPTISSAVTYSKENLTLTHKLRKPLVEKLRRERINSSIDQIKSLLGSEILNQQPDSKMEKADILEMTVSFLIRLKKQHHQPVSSSSCSTAAYQGHSKCVRDMVHFLSKEEVDTQSQRILLSHFQIPQSCSMVNSIQRDLPQLYSPSLYSDTKEKSPVNSGLWRPW